MRAASRSAAAVAVHVHADLDLAHELHQVDHRLAQPVAAADDGARRRGARAFGGVDGAVAVLVDAAAAGGQRHRRARRAGSTVSVPSGPAAVADHVDGERGDAAAAASATRPSNGAPFMLSPKPWPKMATGQPPAGLAPAGRNSVKKTLFVPCAAGVPERVPVGGMNSPGVS